MKTNHHNNEGDKTNARSDSYCFCLVIDAFLSLSADMTRLAKKLSLPS